jgi:ATP/ADP translocase
MFAAVWYVPRYYRSRFGSVEPLSPSNRNAVIFLLVLLALGLFGGPLARYLDSVLVPQASNEIHSMISDPDHRTNLLPVVFWIVLLCARLFRRSRFASYLDVSFDLACLLFWAFALVFYPLRHPDVTRLTFWKVLNVGWFGISMIMAGLYDHLTLVELVPRRARERNNE